jgi:DNA-binding SARP family transcriptional activator
VGQVLPDGIDATRQPGHPRVGSDGPLPPVVAAKVRVPPDLSLPRERLQAQLATVFRHRLAVVVAPAGSGKTSLLASFAAAAGAPVAWYRAETWDGDERAILRHLEAALTSALDGLPDRWRSVEDSAAALESWKGERAILIVDDAHVLEGTAAEDVLGRFIQYAPPWLAIVIGSRLTPGFNLSRLRVSGELLEIGPDDLRFRAWEVERLFRDHYGEPVPPDDLAILARRTEGWAAGLQLFHLATRGKSADERRRILSGAGSSSRLVREYLTWNVMVDLPGELRDFLVDTCALGRLTGPLCDRLLDRHGSAKLLDELFRRQIFTVEVDQADGSYRYHEVFRSHLDRVLVERVGEDEARERYRRAGILLEDAGAPAEALSAYSRAEDWAAVRRLLGGHGERLADGVPMWLESLPAAIIRHEPWLELAAARRARAEGRWTDALDAYGRAETGFGAGAIAVTCHAERQSLRAWLEPAAPIAGPIDWSRMLRNGLVREPLAVAREAGRQDAVPPALVRGLLSLAAGEVRQAQRDLTDALAVLDDQPVIAAVAQLALGIALLLGGDPAGSTAIDRAERVAERAGAPWLARVARSASRLGSVAAGTTDATAAGAVFDADRDPWSAAIVALLEAWRPGGDVAIAAGPVDLAERRVMAAERAAIAFHRLGAGVLEAWARGLLAIGLSATGSPEAREAAAAADSLARGAGTPGVRLLTFRAIAAADPTQRDEYARLADAVRQETGLVDPPAAAGLPEGGAVEPVMSRPDPSSARRDTVLAAGPDIRTFGGFWMRVGDEPLPLDRIKPRARALLRLLALHAGWPVHREVIGSALWPEVDAATAARSLQVAVSSIRGLLVETLGSEGRGIITRDGDAYRLAVPADAIDVRRFERLLEEGRAARRRGESPRPALTSALALYVGDVLPEDGPEEWVVELREHYRKQAVEAAREAAESALSDDTPREAIESCRVGLAIDRFHDPLWRLLIESRIRAGDLSAADRDRRSYEAILVELGLPTQPGLIAS